MATGVPPNRQHYSSNTPSGVVGAWEGAVVGAEGAVAGGGGVGAVVGVVGASGGVTRGHRRVRDVWFQARWEVGPGAPSPGGSYGRGKGRSHGVEERIRTHSKGIHATSAAGRSAVTLANLELERCGAAGAASTVQHVRVALGTTLNSVLRG